MFNRLIFTFLFLVKISCFYAQNNLLDIIKNDTSKILNQVFISSKKYKLQVIYTQINRDEFNIPHFTYYTFGVDSNNYFYPASLVKLPLCALALEKLDSLKSLGVNINSTILFDEGYDCQTKYYRETSSANGNPSIAHCIKQMMLVSNNQAYNRAYEFLGPSHINNRLHQMGYNNVSISHRLVSSCDTLQNRYTNPYKIYDTAGNIIYNRSLQYCSQKYINPTKALIGKSHMTNGQKLVREPMDFTNYNYVSLKTMNDILVSVMFPLAVDSKKRFDISPENYTFLQKYMSMYPFESNNPAYNEKYYPTTLKKYYFRKIKTPQTKNIREYNVVGLA